ncbi:MAG: hypothetical protein ACT4TC_17975 [Myxococcaceae bacterium]
MGWGWASLFGPARRNLQGKFASACPLLEQSYALEPALGTLLNLADCDEKRGRLVKAYLGFNEATAWAHRTKEGIRKEAAASRATALKTRLSWIALSATSPPENLTVSVEDFSVKLGAMPQSVPVDPGAVSLIARAPGFLPWKRPRSR